MSEPNPKKPLFNEDGSVDIDLDTGYWELQLANRKNSEAVLTEFAEFVINQLLKTALEMRDEEPSDLCEVQPETGCGGESGEPETGGAVPGVGEEAEGDGA